MRLILIFSFIIIWIARLIGQENSLVILMKTSGTKQIVALDISGNELFLLPPNASVFGHASNHQFSNNNYTLYDFSRGTLPVYRGDSIVLVNQTGDLVGVIGKEYTLLEPNEGGMFKAKRKYERNPVKGPIAFFGPDGSLMFDGKHFYSATPFKSGRSIVRDVKEGPYYLLTTDGGRIDFEPMIAQYITGVTDFSDSLCVVSLTVPKSDGSETKQFGYVGVDGKLKLNKSKITGKFGGEPPEPFVGGRAYCESGDHIFYNKRGDILFRMANVHQVVRNKTHTMISTLGWGNPYFLYDAAFNHIPLDTGSKKVRNIDFLSNSFIRVEFRDTITKARNHVVIDPVTYKAIDTDEQYEIDALGTTWLNGNKMGFSAELTGIESMDGSVNKRLDVSTRLFTSIKEAMPFKSDVQFITVAKGESIEQLRSFPKLRHIVIDEFAGAAMPDVFASFQSLETLKINECPGLTSLPISLQSKKTFSRLIIYFSPRIAGLPGWVRKCPSLTYLELQNFPISTEEIKKLESERPSLEVMSMQTSDLQIQKMSKD